jgi:hypothetical protein
MPVDLPSSSNAGLVIESGLTAHYKVAGSRQAVGTVITNDT